MFGFGFGERLITPGEPVHRVVLVLEQIGRLFAGEAIGEGVRGWQGRHSWFWFGFENLGVALTEGETTHGGGEGKAENGLQFRVKRHFPPY